MNQIEAMLKAEATARSERIQQLKREHTIYREALSAHWGGEHIAVIEAKLRAQGVPVPWQDLEPVQ